MSEHRDGARWLSRWAGIGIAACAVGFALFYLGLFRRDNAARRSAWPGSRRRRLASSSITWTTAG